MKKIYFTSLDKNFKSGKDVAFGPWCFDSIHGVETSELYNEYENDDKSKLHDTLFNLSYYLLLRDIEKLPEREKRIYYLHKQTEYLYFVFFSFPKWRRLTKLLDDHQKLNGIMFEKVDSYPKKKK